MGAAREASPRTSLILPTSAHLLSRLLFLLSPSTKYSSSPSVIFSEATISYLGLGLKGVRSFGTMLSENQAFINSYSYLILFPAFIISLLMISFNLFGNGLRDALNPSLKGSD